jgi:enamine deaminase RidA (YjgF/YER057c/UK114 family)
MIKRSGNEKIFHEVVEYNGVLYMAGMTAENLTLDLEGQTREMLEYLKGVLAKHGSGPDKLLTSLLFITDMNEKPKMNKAWTAILPNAHLPTRATIGVNDLGDGVLIEGVFSAAKG